MNLYCDELSPLYYAAQEGKLDIDASSYIDDGGDLDISPLYIAVQNNYIDIN